MNFLSFFIRSQGDITQDFLKPLPWIEEKVVQLTWEKTTDKIYKLKSSDNITVVEFRVDIDAFIQVTSSRLTSDIKHITYKTYTDFIKALKTNVEHERFFEWWKALANNHGRLFQFNFRHGPWDVPWEMLLGSLIIDKTRVETTIVRCIDQPEEICKSFWTEAFRILIIEADARDLNLEKDIENLITVWNGLEHNLRLAILEPKIIKASRQTIVQELSEFKPHLIWFVGHGFFDGNVHLVLSEGETITAQEFSELFEQARHCPEFAVFWSCETFKGTETIRSEQPDLFAALSHKGVGTMIGMQSEIGYEAAIVMSNQLFRGLVQGLPLEWAMARARTWLYEIDSKETPTMDWAVPVVWTARRPVAYLKWRQSELDFLQLQLLGSISIEKSQPPGAGLEVEPIDADARARANNWLSFSITVVRGDKKSQEDKLWFLRTLKGVQAVSKKAVLVIQPEEGKYFKQNLQYWARSFLEGLEKGRVPEELNERIDILQNDAEIGWRRLCSLEGVLLAVIGPPPVDEAWFWDPLFELSKDRAILTKSNIPERFKDLQVNYIAVGEPVEAVPLEIAKQKHYRLLVALSLLNLPIKAETLNGWEVGKEADALFSSFPSFFVKTFGGFVTRADVREKVLSNVDTVIYTQALADCLELTKLMGCEQKPYLKEFRIYLLIKSGQEDLAVKELSDLIGLYRVRNEQVPLLRLFEKYFRLAEYLTAWEKLNIADLYLRFGQLRPAKHWLSLKPTHVLDIAFGLSLQAELSKNEGNIDHARELIEQAIEQSRKNQIDPQLSPQIRRKAEQDYLAYCHDRARLLHFQVRAYSEAAKEYNEIIHIIEKSVSQDGNNSLLHLLAVAHRNLGECMLYLSDNDPEDRWREAESHLSTALELEKSNSFFSDLIPEIYYQLVKLAIDRSDPVQEVREQIERCLASAEENRHGLISVIAKNRLLWLDVREHQLRWNDISQRWNLIADGLRARKEHSWVSRTLVNSNVNVACMLIRENEYNLSSQYLLENYTILKEEKFLRREGDLARIAKTLAGLQLIANIQGNKQNYWAQLDKQFPSAGQYARSKGWYTPEDTWEGGHYYGYK